MKKLSHQLINSATNKILILTLNDTVIITESGTVGKLKLSEKVFLSKELALKEYYKKEWAALKKGFVLNMPDAEIGQAMLHSYIGGGYTGSLSFQPTNEGIYIYKNTAQAHKLTDQLILIDQLGTELNVIEMPQPLAWDIKLRVQANSLLLDLDHYIYEFNIEKGTFKNLGKNKSSFTSFISVSKEKIAFANMGQLSILTNQNEVVVQQAYKTQNINGNTPFCACLSTDGKVLAFHNKASEIKLIDTSDGNLLKTIVADFEMVDQLEFADNNSILVVREHYGTWGMRYFDLTSCKEIKIKTLEIPGFSKHVMDFCFNSDQSKLVLVYRSKAHVFNFAEKKYMFSFDIEHIVKSCSVKFIDDKLGVRTDYGCFSIYTV